MSDEMKLWMEEARASHLSWAEHLEAHAASGQPCAACDAKPYKLNPETEREWMRRYDLVIDALTERDALRALVAKMREELADRLEDADTLSSDPRAPMPGWAERVRSLLADDADQKAAEEWRKAQEIREVAIQACLTEFGALDPQSEVARALFGLAIACGPAAFPLAGDDQLPPSTAAAGVLELISRVEGAKLVSREFLKLDAEITEALRLLAPAAPGETLAGAIRNLQQAYVTERTNAETAEREIARLRTKSAAAVLQRQCCEATLSMAVARLGGEVEGAPTHRGNFLQRVDELREIEASLEDRLAARYEEGRKSGLFVGAGEYRERVKTEVEGLLISPPCNMTPGPQRALQAERNAGWNLALRELLRRLEAKEGA
jgi:hypothetical protein